MTRRDYEEACSLLASSVTKSLEALPPPQFKAKGCPRILPKLLSPAAAATARSRLEGEVTQVRVQGQRAFVIFKAPGARLYDFPMIREEDNWKAAVLTATILVPSPATLGDGS